MDRSNVHFIMSPEDTFDITIISTIEFLMRKLIERQTDKKRLYRLDQAHSALMMYESLYVGSIPEEYSIKADAFDCAINKALDELHEVSNDSNRN